MMLLKRKIKSPSNWLMILGMVISLFAFTDGIDLYYKVKYTISEANSFRYLNEYRLTLNDHEVDILAIAADLPGNITADELLVYLDADEGYYSAEMVIKQEEDFSFPVNIIDPEGDVILGEIKKQYCYDREGHSYVLIDGKEFKVAGFVPYTDSDLLLGKLMIIYRKGKTDRYLSNCRSFMCGSNSALIDNAIDTVRMKYRNSININRIFTADINTGSTEYREFQYMVIAFFAMAIDVIISEYWVILREREILIKRLFGFSKKRIVISIYMDMLINDLAAFIIVFGIRAGRRFAGESILLFGKVPITWIMIYMVLSTIIIGMIPAYKASGFMLSKGLGD